MDEKMAFDSIMQTLECCIVGRLRRGDYHKGIT